MHLGSPGPGDGTTGDPAHRRQHGPECPHAEPLPPSARSRSRATPSTGYRLGSHLVLSSASSGPPMVPPLRRGDGALGAAAAGAGVSPPPLRRGRVRVGPGPRAEKQRGRCQDPGTSPALPLLRATYSLACNTSAVGCSVFRLTITSAKRLASAAAARPETSPLQTLAKIGFHARYIGYQNSCAWLPYR